MAELIARLASRILVAGKSRRKSEDVARELCCRIMPPSKRARDRHEAMIRVPADPISIG
jgi:hypothetical protein